MISIGHLFTEEIPASAIKAAIKQAAVWGSGGILASKLSQKDDKKKTKEEKKEALKDTAIQGIAGAAAGAAGALV